MDIYINGVLVILSATDIILDKVYLLSFYPLHSEWTYPILVAKCCEIALTFLKYGVKARLVPWKVR